MNVQSLWNHRCIYQMSWTRYSALITAIANQVRAADLKPDIIIGIAKGGLVPCVTLSHILEIQQFGAIYIRHNQSSSPFPCRDGAELFWSYVGRSRGLNVLIVDDIIGTGETLRLATEIIQSDGPKSIITASLVVNRNGGQSPDFCGIEVDDWILFPWESRESALKRSDEANLSLVDI